MLSAVELNDQSGRMADEVGDVVSDRHLAPEAGAVQPVIAQLRPKNAFGVSGVFAQRAGVRAQLRRYFPGRLFVFRHRDLPCGETPTPPRKRERESELARG